MSTLGDTIERLRSSLGNAGAVANCRHAIEDEAARDEQVQQLCQRLDRQNHERPRRPRPPRAG